MFTSYSSKSSSAFLKKFSCKIYFIYKINMLIIIFLLVITRLRFSLKKSQMLNIVILVFQGLSTCFHGK